MSYLANKNSFSWGFWIATYSMYLMSNSTLLCEVHNCMWLWPFAQIASCSLFSEHHFYGLKDYIIIVNALTHWLLHSLLLVSCNLQWYGNQSSFYCCTHCKSLWITVSAKLLKWQCKVWMMMHSDRWKWRNTCLTRQDFLSLFHSLIYTSSPGSFPIQPQSLTSSHWAALSGWLSGLLYSSWERGDHCSSLTPYRPQMLILQFPGFCCLEFQSYCIYCQKPEIMIWKRLPRKLSETVALSVCWLVGFWYPQCNDRCPQTPELLQWNPHWIIQDRKPKSVMLRQVFCLWQLIDISPHT